MIWNPDLFVRPTAHRGLHDAQNGVIENTWPAFDAAIAAGYGIECDIQRTRDDDAVVFHDASLERLTEQTGLVNQLSSKEVSQVRYRDSEETILTFTDFLGRVDGRAPILVEIKSDWSKPSAEWTNTICDTVCAAHGPIALISFDPDVLIAVRDTNPKIPRGLVSGIYRKPGRDPWWRDLIDADRADRLSRLEPVDTVQPDFIAYHVEDLDSAPVKQAREHMKLPVFTWTVRTTRHWELCEKYADAAIFEGPEPSRD